MMSNARRKAQIKADKLVRKIVTLKRHWFKVFRFLENGYRFGNLDSRSQILRKPVPIITHYFCSVNAC